MNTLKSKKLFKKQILPFMLVIGFTPFNSFAHSDNFSHTSFNLPYSFEYLTKNPHSTNDIQEFYKQIFSQLKSHVNNEKQSEIINNSHYTLSINDYKDNNSFIKNSIAQFSDKQGKEIFSYLQKVDIKTQRFSGLINPSLTNGDISNCSILLAYKPIESWRSNYQPYKELIFSLTHELSHCILGKEVFLGKIDFEITLSPEQKSFIINKAVSQSNLSWLNNQKLFSKPLRNPLIIYHETFADIFALIYLYNYSIFTLKDVENILNERAKSCNNKSNFCNYQSYKYKNEILTTLQKNHIALQIPEIYSLSNLFANKSLLENL